MMFLYQLIRNLEASKRFDLPLGGAVPDGIGAPEHVVCTKRLNDLPEQMRADHGVCCHQLTECGSQFHVDILDLRLGHLHATELRRPGNLTSLGKDVVYRRRALEP